MFRLFLASALLWPAVLTWSAPAAAEAGGSEQRLAEVRSRIERLQREIEGSKSRADALSQEVEKAEQKISGVQRQLALLRRQLHTQQTRVRKAQADLEDADRRLDGHRQSLAAQVRAAYVIGHNASARLLLNLSNMQQVDRMVTYFDYLNRARADQMRGMNAEAEKLRALRDRLDEEAETLATLREEQQAALERLQGLRTERAGQLDQLRQKIGSGQEELQELRETEREIQRVLESIQKTLRELPPEPPPQPSPRPAPEPESRQPAIFSDRPFPTLKGRLPWPVRGPLLAAYGQPKAGGRLSWNGHWIAAETGTPVHAVAAGRVVYTGWMHRYGLIVIVEHEGGYFTLYGHNQSVAHNAGDRVQAGEIVAEAGSTGGHEDAGVYFEVRRGTLSLDPRLWLGR
jgi:septal ring factor EnvC (AmiA/AmiB activator)